MTPESEMDPAAMRRLVGIALRAGVGMVHYCHRDLSRREMAGQATAVVRMTRVSQTALIIRHAIDVALAIGADGVHLDAEDLPVASARRLMGPAAIIGATALTPEDARLAEEDGATYVSVGWTGAPPAQQGASISLDGLDRIRAATALPICVCGDAATDRLEELVAHGAQLIAVGAAIHGQAIPAAAAREIIRRAAAIRYPHHTAP